ncbi:MAG: hypothetical protein H6600_03600 [Flavobacteriales bacterium]|nr:hypothetical protein [Flavobacteriales bacterium]
MKHFKFLFFVLVALLTSCAALPEVTTNEHFEEYKKIEVGFGPEDFEQDPSNVVAYPRLIVACDERREGKTQGQIWEVNLTDFTSRKLEIVFSDANVNFHPHGMSIYGDRLFVISHNGKKEEFFVFKIESDKVVEEVVYSDGLFGHGNDIFAVGKYEYYYSDFKAINGKIVHCLDNECEIVAKHLKYPNGIYVLGEGVYVTTTLQNKVFVYDQDLIERIKIAKVKGGDNLTYDGTSLYTTSHPRFGKFIKHFKHLDKISPSVVYQIGINGNEVIYSNAGDQISAASVAWRYNEYLIIGQVFDNFIWVGKVQPNQ